MSNIYTYQNQNPDGSYNYVAAGGAGPALRINGLSKTVADQFITTINQKYDYIDPLVDALSDEGDYTSAVLINFTSAGHTSNFAGFGALEAGAAAATTWAHPSGSYSYTPSAGAYGAEIDVNSADLGLNSGGYVSFDTLVASILPHELLHPIFGFHAWDLNADGSPSATLGTPTSVAEVGKDQMYQASALGDAENGQFLPSNGINLVAVGSANAQGAQAGTYIDNGSVEVVSLSQYESDDYQIYFNEIVRLSGLPTAANAATPATSIDVDELTDKEMAQNYDFTSILPEATQIIGSAIGNFLGSDSPIRGIVYSSLLGAIGQELGAAVASGGANIEQFIGPDAASALNGLAANVGTELASNAAGTFSSILTLELGQELGLSGFGAQLGADVVNTVVSNVATYGVQSLWRNINPAAMVQPIDIGGALENSIGTFLGAKLGALIYSPQTEAGEIGGSIGSALGSLAGSFELGIGVVDGAIDAAGDVIATAAADIGGEALSQLAWNAVLPGIGALVGFVLGALIGDLFGSKPKIPTASAETILAIPTAEYELGSETSTNGGDLTTPVYMATTAKDALNGILQQITGIQGGTVQNLSSPTQVYGYDSGGLYVKLGSDSAAKNYVATADLGVDKGVLWALPQTQVIGGDIFLKRAIQHDLGGPTAAVSDLTTLMGDLQVASDYEFYTDNRALINAEITAAYATLTSSQMSFYDNNKALVDQVDSQGVSSLNSSQQQTYNANQATIAAIIQALQAQSVANPWIITLQRASELGLDTFMPSDFYGGLQGFVQSFNGSGQRVYYEDVYAAANGSGFTVGAKPNDYTQKSTTDVNSYAAQVYRLYETLLGGPPDEAGDATYVTQLEDNYGLAQVSTTFLGQALFQSNYQNDFGASYASSSNQQFVDNVLFHMVLGRAPNAGEDQAAINALNSGESRGQAVANVIAGSESAARYASAVQGGLTYYDVYELGLLSSLVQSAPDGRNVVIPTSSSIGYTNGSFTAGNDFIDDENSTTGVTLNDANGAGNDIIIGSASYADTITAGSGNDWVEGRNGNDIIYAGSGNDMLSGQGGNDTIYGGSGTDYISGGAGTNYLYAGNGNTTFSDDLATMDYATGGSGNDEFIAPPDYQTDEYSFDGGGGTNTFSFERVVTGGGVAVDMRAFANGGTDDFYGLDPVKNIQNLIGSSFNDTLTAGSGNYIDGGPGNDTITAAGPGDTLEGGPGADTLQGYGDTTASYGTSSAGVYVDLATGAAYGGDADGDTLSGFKNLIGSAYDDTLGGTNGSTLNGGAGDDTLLYSGGNNAYVGDDGFDTVDYSAATSAVTANLQNGTGGGAAAGDTYSSIEKVIGTRYNDTLTASSTGSTFEGGGGSDVFYGGSASDTYILGRGDGYAAIYDNNTDSNAIQIAPGLGFDDLWFGANGGSSGFLEMGIRETGGAQTGDTLYVSGNFGAYPLSADNIIKDLTLDGSSSLDISQVTFITGGGTGNDVLSGPANSSTYSFVIGYEGSDTLGSTSNGQLTQDGTIFFGGTGNDYIDGSSGNNEILFERGDGQDGVNLTGGQSTLIFGSTVSASDIIYQTDSYGNLFIGLRDPSNPNLTASQVSDHVTVAGGAIETENDNTGAVTYSPSIRYVEAGGSTIDLRQAGINYLVRQTSGGGGNYQPIVFDLNGDGLELSSVANSDIGTVDGNGTVTRMSWVGPTDGILVTDRDGTGRYNTTADISFVQDKPGATSDLQGLQAWDTNGDGVLNAQDTDWNKLKIWVDANQDGVAEAGEVETLAQAGISSISLKETPSGFDPSSTFDSYYTGTTTFTHTSGAAGTAYDVTLAGRFLDQTTNAQSGSESWAKQTADTTIGQIEDVGGVVTQLESGLGGLVSGLLSLGGFTTNGAQAAASGASTTINTLGTGLMSAQDANLWNAVLTHNEAALHPTPGTFQGGQYLSAIQNSTAFPAGFDELTGRAASTTTPVRSAEPIILDLSGLGLTQVAPDASQVSFDAAHTGVNQTVGWVGPSDAILAYDANGDGKIDPATEITFKPNVSTAPNSLRGLAAFDTNGDGYLDPGDAAWSKFLVWRDANGNGVADPGETETLSQAGIAKLSLTPSVITPDNGDPSTNLVVAQSNIVMTDGAVRTAYDMELGVKGASTSTSSTTAQARVPASNSTAAPPTPEVQGQGPSTGSQIAKLTPQGASATSGSTAGSTSLARAAEDGPMTPQGADYASVGDTGPANGWWTAGSANSNSILNLASLSSLATIGGTSVSALAAPISSNSDAATLQQQQLLKQSLASFSAPAGTSSAVWARQPAGDLIPTLAAAARPLSTPSPAMASFGG